MTVSPVVPTDVLDQEFHRLIQFGGRFPHPDGGAAWLDGTGAPDLSRPVYTWITARMAHVYSLAHLAGVPGAGRLADQSLDALAGRLRDRKHDGWFSSIAPDGSTLDEKSCYTHAFVVLAASSATVAGRPGARGLLARAMRTWDRYFWDPDHEMYIDRWDRDFTMPDPYRGVNGNMHAVEALLAAADATADPHLRERALTVTTRVVDVLARDHRWRIPEHFDPAWRPLLDHHRDRPADPFQPYGATVGHGLEWARLTLHLHASLGTAAPAWMPSAAQSLFERAVADGWAVDGADGFVYTTDWDGNPVVRDRMHWVVAEAISAAAALHTATGDDRYRSLAQQWWAHADADLLDHVDGSWHHQLDANNRPVDTVWPGKPDLYHAVQTTLIPRLPLTPGMAVAIRGGRLIVPSPATADVVPVPCFG